MCRHTVTTFCEDFYSSQDGKGHTVVGALIEIEHYPVTRYNLIMPYKKRTLSSPKFNKIHPLSYCVYS